METSILRNNKYSIPSELNFLSIIYLGELTSPIRFFNISTTYRLICSLAQLLLFHHFHAVV
jgi:hypothetical protein